MGARSEGRERLVYLLSVHRRMINRSTAAAASVDYVAYTRSFRVRCWLCSLRVFRRSGVRSPGESSELMRITAGCTVLCIHTFSDSIT